MTQNTGSATWRRRLPRWLSFPLSWMHAEFVGYVVCRWYGHVIPSLESIRFQTFLCRAFGNPRESDACDLICSRCGATVDT